MTAAERDLVNRYLRRFPPEISEHTFTNLFAWLEDRKVMLAETRDTLLVAHERDDGRSLLGPPVGPAPLGELLEDLAASGVEHAERIPAETAEALRGAGLRAQSDRDNFDYVYRTEDLAELPGRAYHRQRNLVNQCLSRHDCTYCEITADMLDEVAAMQDRWCEERDCGRSPGLCAEYRAIHRTLSHYAGFELRGAAIRIEGRIEAYTVGEALSPDTAVVHFEKAMTQFTGLYQVINKWFCARGLADFDFVNREQDLGIPGIRRAKESYHPHHMVEKFIAAPSERQLRALPAAAEGRCTE